MGFDLDSPEGRLAALEVLGVFGYNEVLAKTTSREMIVATAAGHEIVIAHSSYGLLHHINGTGKAFAKLESAIQFAEENPASPNRSANPPLGVLNKLQFCQSSASPGLLSNYLIDLKHAVIMDVEATTTIRQAEVGAAKTMLDRTAEQFDLIPSRLVADGGYGSAEMVGWLVDERGIEPQVKLMDKAERTDGTLSRSDFAFDPESNLYFCPGGKELRKYHRAFASRATG